jgi:cytochrome c-type biogenesis protein
MTLDLSLLVALGAGALSFLSPCVLPLVPPYLCFITGASLEELGERTSSGTARRAIGPAVLFVLGFSTVFILLGATASSAGQLLRANLPWLAQVAGLFIILMGLHFLGLFKVGVLNRELRYQQDNRPAGLLGAYAVGLAFAFGWTPCIGPVLATILALAASEDSVARGAMLLGVYSAGLGIPFLLSAAAVGSFLGFLAQFRRHLGKVEKAMGVLLVLAGVGFLTGLHQRFAYWLLETFPGFATLG